MTPKYTNNSLNGWLNIYKEKGLTSSGIIRNIKKKFLIKKIGHYGTLDPLASGVLPVALGEATKTIKYITHDYKKYSFVVVWGEETDSCDAEGKVVNRSSLKPTVSEINSIIKKYFIGDIMQKPPIFSAVKINGKRAYELARKNIKFQTNFKKIKIFDFRLSQDIPKKYSKFVIKCSPGTYVRSLARDLAYKLGTYGFASDIIRKENSFFTSEKSYSFKKVISSSLKSFNKLLLPVDFVLKNYPNITIEKKYSDMLKVGKMIYIDNYKNTKASESDFFLIKCDKELVSIANLEKGYIIPRRNFIN